MFKPTTKRSAKHQPIAPATKQKSAGNSSQRSNVKGPTKKAKNNRKRPASESGDDTSSDEQTKGQHPNKKTKYGGHRDEADKDVEEIDDLASDDPEDVDGNEEPVGEKEASDLEERHHGEIPDALTVKNDATKDLLTIFSDRITVNFKKNGKTEKLKGRWCLPCRANKDVTKGGERNAFFIGGNSSCRSHIRQHYQLYKDRCKQEGIPENHHAIPRAIWKRMEEEKKGKAQAKIDDLIEIEHIPRKQFSRDGALEAIAKFVACDDQALAVVEKSVFRNCLTAMRPNTTRKDLPSKHDLGVYIHNQFAAWLKKLKNDILEAPGNISVTADGWTADNTKGSFLGMTAHWIEVVDNKWKLRSEVVGFQPVSGEHSGWNLGRYFVGLCDRVGIFNKNGSKLFTVTLDNTSNNNTTCKTIEAFHERRFYDLWKAEEGQLPISIRCFGHVVNIANVAVMTHITRIAAIETTTAIWEYDPSLPGNSVLGGSLDVIAAIRTVAIKIQASGQRIEYFEKLQLQCKITEPLRIPLHSNVRWGSAYRMLDRSYKLRQAITLFLKSADALFGPITTIRRNGHIKKKIRWSAFILTDGDWERVRMARDILKDSNDIQEYFSSERLPTLWRALPAIEELQTAWEAKQESFEYALYKNAIDDGLEKLRKYYSRIDKKPVYILSLILHPYYKLDYIKLTWGGAEEQAKEHAAGNYDAKNWQDEARKVIEKTMEAYYRKRPRAQSIEVATPSSSQEERALSSEFDRYRQGLVDKDDLEDEGWASELRRYLANRPADVTKQTNIVTWWQRNAALYPTLARIALDILPCQASSVPCERLFSASKQSADDRRASLGAKRFEELQVMKFAWRKNIIDIAEWNSEGAEAVDLDDYLQLLEGDEQAAAEWDTASGGSPSPLEVVADEFIFED